jgi:hypothetical protein
MLVYKQLLTIFKVCCSIVTINLYGKHITIGRGSCCILEKAGVERKTIDVESQNRLLKVCYVPTISTGLPWQLLLLFFFFAAAINSTNEKTRQAVRAIKQSILIRCLWEKRGQPTNKTHAPATTGRGTTPTGMESPAFTAKSLVTVRVIVANESGGTGHVRMPTKGHSEKALKGQLFKIIRLIQKL